MKKRIIICFFIVLFASTFLIAQDCMIGAFIWDNDPVNPTWGDITAFENLIGRQVAIVTKFASFDEPWSWQEGFCNDVWNHGIDRGGGNPCIPHITWEPKRNGQAAIWPVINGDLDWYLDEWINGIKAFGHPVFIRLGHEMNGNWYDWSGIFVGADAYKQFWHYVVDRFRNAGCNNVSWVFAPMNADWPNESWNRWENYYPGDNYVDWLGVSAYNWVDYGDLSLASVINDFYWRARALAPSKPIMLAEWACAQDTTLFGNKSNWIIDAFNAIKYSYPQIRAECWFHIIKEKDWRIDSDGVDTPRWILSDPYWSSYGWTKGSIDLTLIDDFNDGNGLNNLGKFWNIYIDNIGTRVIEPTSANGPYGGGMVNNFYGEDIGKDEYSGKMEYILANSTSSWAAMDCELPESYWNVTNAGYNAIGFWLKGNGKRIRVNLVSTNIDRSQSLYYNTEIYSTPNKWVYYSLEFSTNVFSSYQWSSNNGYVLPSLDEAKQCISSIQFEVYGNPNEYGYFSIDNLRFLKDVTSMVDEFADTNIGAMNNWGTWEVQYGGDGNVGANTSFDSGVQNSAFKSFQWIEGGSWGYNNITLNFHRTNNLTAMGHKGIRFWYKAQNNLPIRVLISTPLSDASNGYGSYIFDLGGSPNAWTFYNLDFSSFWWDGGTQNYTLSNALQTCTGIKWECKTIDTWGDVFLDNVMFVGSTNHPQDGTPPSTVTLLSPTNNSDTSTHPLLIWSKSFDAESGIDYYVIEFSTNSGFACTNMVLLARKTNLYIENGLSPGTWYWRVRAVNGNNMMGNYSLVKSFNVITSQPYSIVDTFNDQDFIADLNWGIWKNKLGGANNDGTGVLTITNNLSNYFLKYQFSVDTGTWGYNNAKIEFYGNLDMYTLSQSNISFWIKGTRNPNIQLIIETPLSSSSNQNSTYQFNLGNVSDDWQYYYIPFTNFVWNGDDNGKFSLADALKNCRGFKWESKFQGDVGTLFLDDIRFWGSTNHPDLTPPTSVTLLNPTNNTISTNNQPYFEWTASTDLQTGIDHYILELSDDIKFSNNYIIVSTTNTFYSNINISPGIWYWRVRAVNGHGIESSNSSIWSYNYTNNIPFSIVDEFDVTDTMADNGWGDWVSFFEGGDGNGWGNIDYGSGVSSYGIKYSFQVDSSTNWGYNHLMLQFKKELNLQSYNQSAIGFWIKGENNPNIDLLIATPLSTASNNWGTYAYHLGNISDQWQYITVDFTNFTWNGPATNVFTLNDAINSCQGFKWEDVNPGEYGVIQLDEVKFIGSTNHPDGTPPPKVMLIAPANSNTVLVPVNLKWKSVVDTESCAMTYSINVDDDSDFSSIDYWDLTTNTNYILPPLYSKTWYWRVRAINCSGYEGEWSDSRAFIVSNNLFSTVDIFEDSDYISENNWGIWRNQIGGEWNNGTGVISFVPGYSNNSIHYSYTVDGGTWGYNNLFLDMKREIDVESMNQFEIEFWIKASNSGINLDLPIETPLAGSWNNYAHYVYAITNLSTSWTKYTVPFQNFVWNGGGAPDYSLDEALQRCIGFKWENKQLGTSGAFDIDNVRLRGSTNHPGPIEYSLVDNFASANTNATNSWGVWRFEHNTDGTPGTGSISYATGVTDNCMKYTFTVGSGGTWQYNHIRVDFPLQVDLDDMGHYGIGFWVKSDNNVNINVLIGTPLSAASNNWASWQYDLGAVSTNWTYYEIPFSDFYWNGSGGYYSLLSALQTATSIKWEDITAGDNGALYLDNIKFIGTTNHPDLMAPSAPTLVSPISNSYVNNTNVVLVWNVPADYSGIDHYDLIYDGVTNAYLTVTNLVVSNLNEGIHTWKVRAIDNWNNIGPFSSTWDFLVDLTAPTQTKSITPISNLITGSNVNFIWRKGEDTGSGVQGYQLEVFGNFFYLSTNIVGENITNVILNINKDGTKSWRVKVVDNAGNISSYSQEIFIVDILEPPIPVIIYPTNNSYVGSNNPLLRWGQVIDTSGIELYEVIIDGITNTAFTNQYAPGILGEGVHNWQVRAKDNAGHWGNYSAIHSFTVDLTPPGIPALISPTNNLVTNNATIVFDWAAVIDTSGIDHYDIVIAGVTNSVVATEYTQTISEGTNQWQVRAVDNAGNVGSWSGLRSVIVDTNFPGAAFFTNFQIWHDGTDGTINTWKSIELRAKDQFSNIYTNYTGTATLYAVPGFTGGLDWTNINGNGTFNFLGGNKAVYTFVLADKGVVSLAVKDDTVESIDPEAKDSSIHYDNDASPQYINFISAGSPNLSIIKTISNVSWAGADEEPIPGGTITYKVIYSNIGTASANEVVIYDALPANTIYKSNSSSAPAGWTNQYSTNTSPNQAYNSTDYVNSEPLSTDIKWVRWKKPSVAAGENGVIIYKVIIK